MMEPRCFGMPLCDFSTSAVGSGVCRNVLLPLVSAFQFFIHLSLSMARVFILIADLKV